MNIINKKIELTCNVKLENEDYEVLESIKTQFDNFISDSGIYFTSDMTRKQLDKFKLKDKIDDFINRNKDKIFNMTFNTGECKIRFIGCNSYDILNGDYVPYVLLVECDLIGRITKQSMWRRLKWKLLKK